MAYIIDTFNISAQQLKFLSKLEFRNIRTFDRIHYMQLPMVYITQDHLHEMLNQTLNHFIQWNGHESLDTLKHNCRILT